MNGIWKKLCICMLILYFITVFSWEYQSATRVIKQRTNMSSSASSKTNKDLEKYLKQFWIDDYLEKHLSKNISDHSRILAVSLSNSGLGDIYSGLISAFYIARLTNRILVIKDDPGFDLGQILDEEAVRRFSYGNFTGNLSITEQFIHNKDGINNITKRALIGSMRSSRVVRMKTCYKYSIQDIFWFAYENHIDLAEDFPAYVIDRDMEHEINRLILLELFPLPASVIRKFKYYSEYLNIEEGNYISIHARLGLGVNESHHSRFSFAANNMDKVANCFAELVTKNESIRKIYVATDTPEFKHILQKSVKAISKEFDVIGAPWPHTGHIRMQTGDLSIQKINMENTLIELLLVAHSKYFFHLFSGFSLVARRMGIRKQSMLILPNSCKIAKTDMTTRINRNKIFFTQREKYESKILEKRFDHTW